MFCLLPLLEVVTRVFMGWLGLLVGCTVGSGGDYSGELERIVLTCFHPATMKSWFIALFHEVTCNSLQIIKKLQKVLSLIPESHNKFYPN